MTDWTPDRIPPQVRPFFDKGEARVKAEEEEQQRLEEERREKRAAEVTVAWAKVAAIIEAAVPGILVPFLDIRDQAGWSQDFPPSRVSCLAEIEGLAPIMVVAYSNGKALDPVEYFVPEVIATPSASLEVGAPEWNYKDSYAIKGDLELAVYWAGEAAKEWDQRQEAWEAVT